MAFPARLAAIDIGSNAIRFLAADFQSPTNYHPVEQLRLAVRLGRSVFDTGQLSDDVIHAATNALVTLSVMMRDLAVDGYRAVATSAVRESRNASELIERAKSESRIEVETIDGDEEARLVYLAARARLNLGDGLHLLVDIGGGSMEVGVVDAERMHFVESFPVGALRFAARSSDVADDVTAIRQSIDDFIAGLRASPAFAAPLSTMIATGGSIDTLARIAGSNSANPGVLLLRTDALRQLIDEIAPLNYHTRAKRFKLSSDRADVILPGAILYERIAAAAGITDIAAPQVGVREGVLLDFATRLALDST